MRTDTTGQTAPPIQEARGIGVRRLLQGSVLTAWAGLFWFLLISGRTSLYLSSRIDWLVPVGAVILTIAAVGRLATLERSSLTI